MFFKPLKQKLAKCLPQVVQSNPGKVKVIAKYQFALEGNLDGNNDTCKYMFCIPKVVFISLMLMPSIAPSVLTTQLVTFNREQVIMKMKMEMTLMTMSIILIKTPVQSLSLLRKNSCDMRKDTTCKMKNIYNGSVF